MKLRIADALTSLLLFMAVSAIAINPVSAALWTQIPGQTPSAPAAVWNPDMNKIHVVVRASDNSLWFATLNEDMTVQSDFKSIPGGTPTTPALAWNPELKKIHIMVRDTNSNLWFATLNQDGTFYSDWKVIAGLLGSAPVLIWNPNLGKIHVIGRASDNTLWFATLNQDGTFYKGWSSFPGSSPSSPAAVWDPATGKIQVLVRGADNSLWLAMLNQEGTIYQDWKSVSGSTPSPPALVFNTKRGKSYIYIRDSSGAVEYAGLNSDGTLYQSWQTINSSIIESPAAAYNTNSDVTHLLVTAPNGQIFGWNFVLPSGFIRPICPPDCNRNLNPSGILTTANFSVSDYSIESTASGGKRLGFFLTGGEYKAGLFYSIEPEQKFITKTFCVMNASGQFGEARHDSGSGSAYVTINGQTFKIGNTNIERTLSVAGAGPKTTEVYNKISGKRHVMNSDEFGIMGSSDNPLFIDVERLWLDESVAWSRDVGDPLIFSDFYVWNKNPFSVPIMSDDRKLIVERIYPLSGIGSDCLFGYETVLGSTENNRGLEGFRQYFSELKNQEKKFYFTYNTWWTINPYNQDSIINLVDQVDSQLSSRSARLDSFTLDDGGWANPQSIWKVNPFNFPQGLAPVKQELNQKGMGFGLWFSPSAAYSSATDKDWAEIQGYYVYRSTNGYSHLCFYDTPGKLSYYSEMKSTFSQLVSSNMLSNLKFDTFWPCNGFAPQEWDNFADFANSLKKINPQIKYELNLWVFNPGVALLGDWMFVPSGDYSSGILPAIKYKDAYTTTRDQFWIDYGSLAVPPDSLHELGIIIQTDEDWKDDAVVNLLRGTGYIPLYVNLAKMTSSDWDYLANLIKWARLNQETLLSNTYFLGGQPKNGEVYGFAHFNSQTNEGYVMLRNPSMEGKDFSLKLDSSIGLSADGQYIIKVVYPYKYAYDSIYNRGGSQNIHLEGFETLVLHIKPFSSINNELVGARYEYLIQNGKKILRVWSKHNTKINPRIMLSGPSYTNVPLGFCSSESKLQTSSSQITKTSNSISGSFSISSTSNFDNELIVLVNSPNKFDVNSTNPSFSIDGQSVTPTKQTSSDQWTQIDAGANLSHYWVYFRVPISSGNHNVSFSVNFPSGLSSSASILYNETLVSRDIEQGSWMDDSDEYLKPIGIDTLSGNIPVGQNYNEYTKCQPADLNNDGKIDDLELTAFIGRWKVDSSNPTLKELMEAIGLWKSG